ncbi:uncharacterized protein LOC135845511 isoform X1 [Planococcus citri]|uniref:uncharacterized protein LOC135845511 isoform X1 n=1 Tax=Planococcus citri TaxID=170843 RepID=UPI0031F742BB
MVSESEFYKDYCRICGSSNGICIELFSNEGKDYLNQVQSLLNMQICKDDALPKNICHICVAFMTDFVKFRNHCEIVQTKLIDLAGNFCKEKAVSKSTNGNTIQSNGNKIVVKSSPSKKTHTADNSPISRKIQAPTDAMIVDLKDVPDSNDNPVTKREKTEIKTKPPSKDWSVEHIPGSNTTLYICNNCSEMLLAESATRSHQCQTSPKITHILPQNQLLPQETKHSEKKRKRILFEGDDD